MSARARRLPLLATLAAALLLALLPCMVAMLAGAPAPGEGLSPAAVARDLSAAALDRLDRLLHGECCVRLDAVLAWRPLDDAARPAAAAAMAPVVSAGPVRAADAARRC